MKSLPSTPPLASVIPLRDEFQPSTDSIVSATRNRMGLQGSASCLTKTLLRLLLYIGHKLFTGVEVTREPPNSSRKIQSTSSRPRDNTSQLLPSLLAMDVKLGHTDFVLP